MSGTNSSFSLYHLTDQAGWCAVIGAVPVRTLYELDVLYHDYREMTRKRDEHLNKLKCLIINSQLRNIIDLTLETSLIYSIVASNSFRLFHFVLFLYGSEAGVYLASFSFCGKLLTSKPDHKAEKGDEKCGCLWQKLMKTAES